MRKHLSNGFHIGSSTPSFANSSLSFSTSLTSNSYSLTSLSLFRNLLYKLLKLLFIIWLIHPEYLGALYLYTLVIEDLFERHKDKVLNLSYAIVQRLTKTSDKALQYLGNNGREEDALEGMDQ